MGLFEDLKYKYAMLNAFGKLIVINCVIFILGFIVSKALPYITLPSDIGDFIFRPWSIITYAFVHTGFWHLAFNMLFLFYLSRVAINLFNQKLVLNVYFLGIILGGTLFLAVANLWPTNFFGTAGGTLIGASAGVSALLLFVATYIPNAELRPFGLFTVKWQYIALAFVIKDVLLLLMGINQGGYIAHMGGYLLGYYYALQLQKGTDIGTGFQRMMDAVLSWFSPKKTLKTVHRSKKKKPAKKTKVSRGFEEDTQKKIDSILDKISKSGYESLTEVEKEFLFKAGK